MGLHLLASSVLGSEKHQKQAKLTAGRDFEATKKIFDKYKPTHVIHCTSVFVTKEYGQHAAGGRCIVMNQGTRVRSRGPASQAGCPVVILMHTTAEEGLSFSRICQYLQVIVAD